MMKKNALIAAAIIAIASTSNVYAQDGALTVSVKRLTLETARKIAIAAIAECRKQGYQVSVTVVDRNGIPQVMERDTIAPPISAAVSKDKAYASANFSTPSGEMSRFKDSPLYHRDGLQMSAGGLLIEAGGYIYGAVGVSGAPGGDIDESCAKAGVDAVIVDLEMQ